MQDDAEHPATRLYVIVNTDDRAIALRQTELAIGNPLAAALLLQSATNFSGQIGTAQEVTELAHRADVAVMIDTTGELPADLNPDGMHLRWNKSITDDYKSARERLGPDVMIGADVGRSRHDAMSLGEAGADYIAFSAPIHLNDREKAVTRRLELIDWWSTVFEVACVAIDVKTATEAEQLAAHGADFVAIEFERGHTTTDLKTWLDDITAAVAGAAAKLHASQA